MGTAYALLGPNAALSAVIFAGVVVWLLHALRGLPEDWREFRKVTESESKIAIAVIWVVSLVALAFAVDFVVTIARALLG